jgi:phospholipase D1/2
MTLTQAKNTTMRQGPAWSKLALIVVVIFAVAMAWRYTPLARFATPERVIGWARNAGDVRWAPFAVMAAYVPAAFVMFPRPMITLFAVIAFGPWLGFATSMTGIIAAALATYGAGRVLPADTVRQLGGDQANRMSEVLRRRGLLAVFAVRIVPAGPFFMVGLVAGAVRIRMWHYLAGTVMGMAPGTLTTTVFGDQFATALEDPSRINYWLVGAVALLFVMLMWYVRKWFARETPDTPSRRDTNSRGPGAAAGTRQCGQRSV